MHGTYVSRNEGVAICGRLKKCKGRISRDPLMSTDHQQLDVCYISALIRLLVAAELSISMAAIQAFASQITVTYSCTYMKGWLAKQRAIADSFGDWATSYRMLPLYIDVLCQENLGTVMCGVLKMVQRLAPTNSSSYTGHLVPLSKASRVVAL